MRRHAMRRRFIVEQLEDRTVPSGTSLLIDPTTYDPGSILVRFRPEAGPVELPDGMEYGDSWALVPGLHEVRLAEGISTDAALAALRANPDVLYAHPDYQIQLNVVPNDPNYASMWALNNTGQTGGTADADIDAPEAWDVTTGNSSIIVAVIDTGVNYNHPDLAANMWVNQGEANGQAGVDDDNNGFVDDIHGYDFVANDGDPRDEHFHGTHVAGTIAAVGDNAVGVAGVAWNVQIMALRFLDANGSGSLSDAISALQYAVANGAQISNNSWGGGGFDQGMVDAIAQAAQAGHIFVAAAGNDGSNNDASPAYPASYANDNIISVAATDHNDARADFSNYGATTVDLGAPGVSILSTLPTYQTPAMNAYGLSTNYGSISGTSMATPHVAGVVALVYGQHPDWSYSQIINQVLSTVDPISSMAGITVSEGRLNAAAAVGNPVPDRSGPRVIAHTPSGMTSGSVSAVRLTFNEAVNGFDAGDVVRFTGPNSMAIAVNAIVAVAGSNDRQWEVQFDTQTELGNYELVVGPNIFDAAGNAMDQNRNGQLGESPDDEYTAAFALGQSSVFHSTDVPAPIFDFTITQTYLNIDQDITIGDLNVQLDISHTYVGDLLISLVGPNGTQVVLAQFHGGAGADYRGTIFDDEASVWVGLGSAPFAGSFSPDSPLSAFDGLNARGTWYLQVEDWAWIDEGTVNAWSITIEPGAGQPPPPLPSNNPPTAAYDYAETQEDNAVLVAVLANDTDPDGDPLTILSIDGVSGGSAVIEGDSVRFTPDANFNGMANFTYTIGDGRGGTSQSYADIQVFAVNDAPTAVADQANGFAGAAMTFGGSGSLTPLQANDQDVDGDGLSIASVGNAVRGSAVLNGDGSVTFTPEAGYLGAASFNYTVTDGEYSSTATVSVNVRAVHYLSMTTNGTLPGPNGTNVSFADADILQLIIDANGPDYYQMYFDGSDVGLTTANEDIDAFTILADGRILIATVGNYSVPAPGGGSLSGGIDDILALTPSSLGEATAGSWSRYFDGSDVGLTSSSENIDAIAVLSDGSILISTTGAVSVPGVSGADADLLRFVPTSLGNTTAGSWSMYFDGSDVGLSDNSSEDLSRLFVAQNGGSFPTLYLGTTGNFAVSGVSGANEDLVAFRPTQLGGTTTGSYGPGLAFDGSVYGLASFNVDGHYMGVASNQHLMPAGGLGMRSLPAEGAVADSSGPAGDAALVRTLTEVAATVVRGGSPAEQAAAVDALFAQAAGTVESWSSVAVSVFARSYASSLAPLFAFDGDPFAALFAEVDLFGGLLR
jgi:subtilisin family serine protease/subtilisin-like proprotein convertase family protein